MADLEVSGPGAEHAAAREEAMARGDTALAARHDAAELAELEAAYPEDDDVDDDYAELDYDEPDYAEPDADGYEWLPEDAAIEMYNESYAGRAALANLPEGAIGAAQDVASELLGGMAPSQQAVLVRAFGSLGHGKQIEIISALAGNHNSGAPTMTQSGAFNEKATELMDAVDTARQAGWSCPGFVDGYGFGRAGGSWLLS